MSGLYLHLPFCVKKCPYCDFNTWPLDELGAGDHEAKFFAALGREASLLLQAHAAEEGAQALETLYFGGGTPSLSEPARIAALIEKVRAAGHAPKEITLEANPESFSEERFAGFVEAGVNRISVGVQSFNDQVLRALGREHDAQRARQVLAWLRGNGRLLSWNFDLIYGVWGAHGVASFERELDELLEWAPPHVSLYALEVHGATAFGARARAGEQLTTGDDAQADLFELARTRLLDAGYRHYEIANFAKPGHEAVHNSLYWRAASVLAAGPGATGFWRGADATWGLRWKTPRSMPSYLDWCAELGDPSGGIAALLEPLAGRAAEWEHLDEAQALSERMILGLRLLEEGLDLQGLEESFGADAVSAKLAALEHYLSAGWLARSGGRLFLKGERALVANALFAALMD